MELPNMTLSRYRTDSSGALPRETQIFLHQLHQKFNTRRLELLQKRKNRAEEIENGKNLDFLPETAEIRNADWKILGVPLALQDRRVEITGPAEPKMIINALNSDAKVFMADFEDSLSPTWENIITGHRALSEAVRGRLVHTNEEGKTYHLNVLPSKLVVRPRGLHLEEENFKVSGLATSGSLFDFGIYFFQNAHETIERGFGPYFYLPKLESHLEARWWNDVFNFAEKYLHLPTGTIKSTVLIETLPAAFEMDEILFELRDHVVALNAGRWDYIFSLIKKYKFNPEFLLPDRDQVTMTTDFMKSYCELLVQTCHRRGAHAIGGMSAFIPNRKEPEVTALALKKVAEDKKREATMGFDGTWVAHPDLIPTAAKEFNDVLGEKPHQKNILPQNKIQAINLLNTKIENAQITEAGICKNISVSIQYMNKWLQGQGAVAINNLMEDAATAEISRMQLWQWLRHQATWVSKAGEKQPFELKAFDHFFDQECKKLYALEPEKNHITLKIAAKALYQMVISPDPDEFLTLKLPQIFNQIEI